MADKTYGIGHKHPPEKVAWTQRDLLIYAAGVGATLEEPNIAYELAPHWAPMPTYPVVLTFKGASQEIVNFEDYKSRRSGAPGLPDLSKSIGVHAEQSIEILRPLPASVDPADGWTLQSQLTGVADSGKGLRVETSSILADGQGTEYARLIMTTYSAGNFQLGKFSKTIAAKPPVAPLTTLPDRGPDRSLVELPPLNTSVVYRLSGDYNPLHIDPNVGKKMFGGTINHGLNSFGYAARHIITACAGGRPERLVYMRVKFASPVKPGDALETKMWSGDPLGDGRVPIHFVQINQTTGKPCLASGVALIAPEKRDSKL